MRNMIKPEIFQQSYVKNWITYRGGSVSLTLEP